MTDLKNIMKKTFCLLFLITIFLAAHHRDARAGDSPNVLGIDHALHASFLDFAFSRIQILNRNYMHTPENILIEPNQALFIARYHKTDPSSVTIEVKQINSGLTPFIGILRYVETVYESNGACPASVVDGPFSPVHHRKVTEIFRYVQNRWQ